MKKFLDLKSGDSIYVIEINQSNWEILSKSVKTFSCYTRAQYQSTTEERTIHFKNSTEMVRVNSNSSIHRIVHSRLTERIETVYFADKDYIESFLKEKIESLRKSINNLENVYSDIWEEFNKEELNKPLDNSLKSDSKTLVKGDIIYVVAFESAAVFDGVNTLYFADGDSYELSKIRDYRKADNIEIGDFFDISLSRIKNSIVSTRIEEMLEKCGYHLENNKFIRLS